MLGRNIARLDDCTGFKNTGFTEDEGQFIQDVYPTAFHYGGPGRFGFDQRSYRTESSPLLTAKNVARLKACWHAYWDKNKTICVEKTPANLLMTRFLQAAFPNSYFIVIRRHPVAVSLATKNLWKIHRTSLYRLFEHWLHCHQLFERDKPFLKHVYELTYEEYIRDPVKYHEEIAGFLGTRISGSGENGSYRYVVRVHEQVSRIPDAPLEQITRSYNEKYLKQWGNLLNHSAFKSYYRYIAEKYESGFHKYGYSLFEGLERPGGAYLQRGPYTAVGVLCCRVADLGALLWRMAARAKFLFLRSVEMVVAKSRFTKGMPATEGLRQ